MSLLSDIMIYSVLGFISDIRIEFQAPVVIVAMACQHSRQKQQQYCSGFVKNAHENAPILSLIRNLHNIMTRSLTHSGSAVAQW